LTVEARFGSEVGIRDPWTKVAALPRHEVAYCDFRGKTRLRVDAGREDAGKDGAPTLTFRPAGSIGLIYRRVLCETP